MLLTNEEKDDILVKYFALQHYGGSFYVRKKYESSVFAGLLR